MTKKPSKKKLQFALCLCDSEPDLEFRKVYQVLPDAAAAKNAYLRVIDESGEDYLYPTSYFVAIEVPQPVGQALLSSS
jgi:hypothetical protein